MNDQKRIDPEFVAHLEWELKTTMGRRYLHPSKSKGDRKMTRIFMSAGMILSSMLVGGAGTYAVTHEQDAKRRNLLIQRAEIQLASADRVVATQATILAEAHQQAADGVISSSELVELETALVRAEVEREILMLNLKEIREGGREPADDLGAPLIGGVDYVRDRIELRMRLAERHLEASIRQVKRIEGLVEKNLVPKHEARDAIIALTSIEAELNTLANQLQLRQAYLNNDLTAEAAELEAMINSAAAARDNAAARIDALVANLTRLQSLHKKGFVSTREIREAQMDLERAESEIHQQDAELEYLKHRRDNLEQ